MYRVIKTKRHRISPKSLKDVSSLSSIHIHFRKRIKDPFVLKRCDKMWSDEELRKRKKGNRTPLMMCYGTALVRYICTGAEARFSKVHTYIFRSGRKRYV